MTRARHTLLLTRFHQTHGLQDGLADHPAVLWREPMPIHPSPPAMECRHIRAELKHVVLSFAGRYPSAGWIPWAVGASGLHRPYGGSSCQGLSATSVRLPQLGQAATVAIP